MKFAGCLEFTYKITIYLFFAYLTTPLFQSLAPAGRIRNIPHGKHCCRKMVLFSISIQWINFTINSVKNNSNIILFFVKKLSNFSLKFKWQKIQVAKFGSKVPQFSLDLWNILRNREEYLD